MAVLEAALNEVVKFNDDNDKGNFVIDVLAEFNKQLPAQPSIKQRFVNVYRDKDGGRFISNQDWENAEDAAEWRDHLPNYIETVEIIRRDA